MPQQESEAPWDLQEDLSLHKRCCCPLGDPSEAAALLEETAGFELGLQASHPGPSSNSVSPWELLNCPEPLLPLWTRGLILVFL